MRVGFVWMAVMLGGCCEPYETATCGALPDDGSRIVGFTVETTTGSDGSDADIEFCVNASPTVNAPCDELSTAFDDNFQEDSIETFEVDVEVDVDAFTGFYLRNLGGGEFLDDPVADLLLSGNDWKLAALKVTAELSNGDRIVIYEETDICDGQIEATERYTPMACTF